MGTAEWAHEEIKATVQLQKNQNSTSGQGGLCVTVGAAPAKAASERWCLTSVAPRTETLALARRVRRGERGRPGVSPCFGSAFWAGIGFLGGGHDVGRPAD